MYLTSSYMCICVYVFPVDLRRTLHNLMEHYITLETHLRNIANVSATFISKQNSIYSVIHAGSEL